MLGNDVALLHLDRSFAQHRLVALLGGDHDLVAQHDLVGLGAVGATVCRDVHDVLVLHLQACTQVLQLDNVGTGDVLHGGFGVELIGALVAREADDAGKLHGDLAALHGELAGHAGHLLEDLHGPEIGGRAERRQPDHHGDRQPDARRAHHDAVTPGAAYRAVDVAAARGSPPAFVRVDDVAHRTAHTVPVMGFLESPLAPAGQYGFGDRKSPVNVAGTRR